jgi:hypothetical protein
MDVIQPPPPPPQLLNGHAFKPEHATIPHTEEKDLPGGWVVQKIGGTSVGKFAVQLVEDVIRSQT